MARTSNRGGRNNNPQGHNQYDRGWVDTAKERPMATAAAAAAAVGAGVFLWSRRNQITDQISHLSDQISDWRSGMGTDNGMTDTGQSESFMASSGRRGGRKSQSDIAEEALTLKETGASSNRSRSRATA
jgi:hypothetical protein